MDLIRSEEHSTLTVEQEKDSRSEISISTKILSFGLCEKQSVRLIIEYVG